MSAYTSVIVVAAGSASRMGFDKIFEKIGGKTVIEYTLEAFEKAQTVNEIIVVSSQTEKMRDIVRSRAFAKVSRVCSGGATRAESVKRGLAYVSGKCEFVSIHDGARPLVMPEEIDAVQNKAYETGAALCGYYVTDSVKAVDADGVVTASLDRRFVFCAATPQVFRLSEYRKALAQYGDDLSDITDDAGLMAKCGVTMTAVPCSKDNFKLTTAEDFTRLRSVMEKRGQL